MIQSAVGKVVQRMFSPERRADGGREEIQDPISTQQVQYDSHEVSCNSSVLQYVHAKLCKLEESHRSALSVINELQKTIATLVLKKSSDPDLSLEDNPTSLPRAPMAPIQPHIPARYLGNSGCPSSRFCYYPPGSKYMKPDHQKDGKKSWGTQANINKFTAPSHPLKNTPTLIDRATTVQLELARGQDPQCNLPMSGHPCSSRLISGEIQQKVLPDGSTATRMRPGPRQYNHRRKFFKRNYNRPMFQPAPTCSEIEIHKPYTNSGLPASVSACPMDPFAKIMIEKGL